MTLSIKQVRYFIAAADAGQVSQAAIELNVSQSAVTAAIKQLEDDLGVRLFDRQPSGVALTAEGARFLQHARIIMAAVNEAVSAPLTEEPRMPGMSGSASPIRSPAISCRATMPASCATIRASASKCANCRATRSRRAWSTARSISPSCWSPTSPTRTRIASETLFRSRRRLWLPVEHPLLNRENVTLADVASEPYVMLTVDEAMNTAGKYWARAGLEPRMIVKTSSVEAVRSMVAAGMGVTILSDMVYRPWSLEGQRIETRNVIGDIPTMDVGLAWNRAVQQGPATRVFHDFMSMTFSGASAM